jgi:hypothetical protein
MRLLELFQKSADIRWAENNKKYAEAYFEIGDKRYKVYFEKADVDNLEKSVGAEIDVEDIWLVEFSLEAGAAEVSQWDKYSITGTGAAYEVLASVIQAINEFKQSHRGAAFSFMAHEPSRISLYKKLSSKMSSSVKTFARPDGTYFLVGA